MSSCAHDALGRFNLGHEFSLNIPTGAVLPANKLIRSRMVGESQLVYIPLEFRFGEIFAKL